MDPLSITTAVVSLTGACLVTAKRISDLRTRFNVTSIILTAILSETTVVSASLGQIQAALLRFSSTFASQFERDSTLLQTLDTAIIGCSVVILALQDEVEKLEAGLLKATSDRDNDQIPSNWLFKMKILWKENTMRELLTQIRNQQVSLGFLLQALNMNSMTELHNLMTNSSSILNQLTENTSTLCKTYPSIRAPRSIFEVDRDDGVSFFSHTASSAGATEFDFDNFLVDSKVYRRAFQGGYLRPRHLMDDESSLLMDTNSGQEGDAETITDSNNGEGEAREDETIRDAESEAGSEEAETIMDTHSEYGSREVQTNTPDTDQWSPRLPEEYTILKVKAVDGEVVYMDTRMVEELLEQHDELTKKCRKLQRHHDAIERKFEIQDLENERSELQARLLGFSLEKCDGTPLEANDLPKLPADIFDAFPSSEQLFRWPDGQLAQFDIFPADPSTSVGKFHVAIDTPTQAEFLTATEVPIAAEFGMATEIPTTAAGFPTKISNRAESPTIPEHLIGLGAISRPEVQTSLSCPFCSLTFTGKWSNYNLRRHVRELHGSAALQTTSKHDLVFSTQMK